MSDKDAYTKKYMSNNSVFADAFNFFLYNGEQIIKPENLKPLDTSAVSIPFGQDAQMPVQKIRDLLYSRAEISSACECADCVPHSGYLPCTQSCA